MQQAAESVNIRCSSEAAADYSRNTVQTADALAVGEQSCEETEAAVPIAETAADHLKYIPSRRFSAVDGKCCCPPFSDEEAPDGAADIACNRSDHQAEALYPHRQYFLFRHGFCHYICLAWLCPFYALRTCINFAEDTGSLVIYVFLMLTAMYVTAAQTRL